MERRIGLVLLAAGGATRMGTAKQLLPYLGRSLLRHAAEVAVASGLAPVLVVLGAQADRLETELAGLQVGIVTNDEWEKGMGGSIRAGIRAMQAAATAGVEAVVFTVCDQPLVGPDVIGRLVEGYLIAHRGSRLQSPPSTGERLAYRRCSPGGTSLTSRGWRTAEGPSG